MNIKWGALAEVATVSLGATVGVVVFFALGVRALAGGEEQRAAGRAVTARTAVAGLCFTLCAGAVLYGLYLIVPQFH